MTTEGRRDADRFWDSIIGTNPSIMPRINPHASALQQDKQLREQMKWLKEHGFKSAREAQEAGY